MDTVVLGEAVGFPVAMLMNAQDQIVGHTRVKRAVSPAREDAHEIEILASHRLGSRIGR